MELKEYVKNPLLFFWMLGYRGFLNWVPDALYLKIMFRVHHGYFPDLNNPKTFNEKIQWLKLHDRKDFYTSLVDKFEVRKYIAENVGEEYLVPLIGVWNSFDDIDFEKLPEQFALKCSHDSGGLVICRNKALLDVKMVRRKLSKCFLRNYYWIGREYPYKNVRSRIIAEKFLDNDGDDVIDYKVHCFDGKPAFILTCSERFSSSGLKEDFYDLDWKKINVSRKDHPNSIKGVSKPSLLLKMLELSEKLSKNFRFLRVDFYEVKGRLYCGELTFYPASGFSQFNPKSWDDEFGKMLNLL